jgi:hypothetical protein
LAGIDGLVDGGILPERPPSTLVRIDPGTGTGRVSVVRPGAVTISAIERVLGPMARSWVFFFNRGAPRSDLFLGGGPGPGTIHRQS